MIKFFMVFRFLFIFSLFFGSVFAKFAVVNIKKIEDESTVAKFLKEELQKASKSLDEDISIAREKMEKKVAELQKIAPTLSPDAVEKRKSDLQKEFVGIESELQEKESAMQEARMLALEEMNAKIKQIAEKIAKEKSFEAVFPDNVMIYYSLENDITKDIIQILNKEMKTVNFNVKKSTNKKK
jgi:Skp family chaperone for outer membrane proteins